MDMATAPAELGATAAALIEVHQEAGADRLADLVNEGAMFDPCFTGPRLLACIARRLGDFHPPCQRAAARQEEVRPPVTLARLSPAAGFMLGV